MQKSVTKYFAAADAALSSSGILENGIIKSAYKGAVSAFGASLIMSGLVPTIQFYMAESDKRSSDGKKIVTAIAKTIEPGSDAEKLKKKVMEAQGKRAELLRLKKQITDAAIALKIMMRTYTFE
jgi:CRISPR-associated protein Cmr5